MQFSMLSTTSFLSCAAEMFLMLLSLRRLAHASYQQLPTPGVVSNFSNGMSIFFETSLICFSRSVIFDSFFSFACGNVILKGRPGSCFCQHALIAVLLTVFLKAFSYTWRRGEYNYFRNKNKWYFFRGNNKDNAPTWNVHIVDMIVIRETWVLFLSTRLDKCNVKHVI